MASAPPEPTPEIDRDNPWPGLAPFTEDLRGYFYGRERETDELSRLVKRQTLTVLFGQSGLGKSSLIQAGLFPLLREGDHLPLYLRLDHSAASPALADQVKAALTAAYAAEKADAPAFRQEETLWEYFHRKDVDIWSAKNRLLTPVLAFDQFEEIFTLGRADDACSARSRAFLAELSCLVENRPPAGVREKLDRGDLDPGRFNFDKPSCQVILSLREDYLPDLEGLRQEMPALIHNRLRLKKLSGLAALDIVQKPAPHLLAPGVAEKIVEFVAGARGGSAERLAELDVEPPLLSVICRELNDRRRALRQAQITADLVSGNRREILHDFYERSVADLPEAMRRFVEDRLLTKSGFRDNLAIESALECPGVTRPLLDTLVARRLLRIEDRLGVQRLELTHDVLAEVIRASRDERQQRLALARSVREARQQRWIIAGLGAAVVALCVGALIGWRAQRQAERATRLAAAQSSRTDVTFTAQLFDQGRVPEALAYLVRAARADPSNSGVGPRLITALAARSFARPVGQPLEQHGPLTRVKYSHDGRRAYARGQDDSVSGWDLASGKRLVTIVPAGGHLDDFSESPDGRRIATASEDGSTRVWDAASGQLVLGPFHQGLKVEDVEFSPDGRWLAAGSADHTVKIWDAATGELRATLDCAGWVTNLSFDPSSRRLLTAALDGLARVWRVPDGAPLTPVLPADRWAHYATFSPDGKLFVITDQDGAQLWNAALGVAVGARMPLAVFCDYAVFSADGKMLVTLSGRIATVWEVPSGRRRLPELEHSDTVQDASFSPDGRLLATISIDGVAHIWDTATGRPALEPIRTGVIADAEFKSSGSELITAGNDGAVRRWRVEPGAVQPLHLAAAAGRIGIDLTPDRTAVRVLASDRLELLDLSSGREVAPPRLFPPIPLQPSITYFEFSPDGRFLGIGRGSSTTTAVDLWDLRGPIPVGHILPGGSNRRYLKFSPDSSRLAVADEDGKIRAWDTASAALVFESSQHPDFFTTMRYSPDGRQLVVAAQAQGLVLVLDAANGKVLGEPLALGNNANDVTFSPDGRLIATASHTDLRLWDAATHLPAGAPMHHRTFLNRVQFSGDGSRLAARERRAVRIWDTQSATAVTDALPGGGDGILATAFSPDGTQLASATFDGSIRVWDAATGQLLLEPAKVEGPIKTDSLNFDASGRFLTVLTQNYDFYAWSLPASSFGHPVPPWLLQLATALAGGVVDDGALFREQAADASTFEAIGDELAALPEDAPFAAWGRWFLADPATRSLAPDFTLTPAEAAKLDSSLASLPAGAELTPPAPGK